MKPDGFGITLARARQLKQIKEFLPRLVERACKCDCGKKFKVVADSPLLFGSLACARDAGWKGRNMFGPQGEYQIHRRWLKPSAEGMD